MEFDNDQIDSSRKSGDAWTSIKSTLKIQKLNEDQNDGKNDEDKSMREKLDEMVTLLKEW